MTAAQFDVTYLKTMYIPLVRDAVEIEGYSGLYFVVRADYRRQVADLIPRHGRGADVCDVPFHSLSAYRRAFGGVIPRVADPRFTCNPC